MQLICMMDPTASSPLLVYSLTYLWKVGWAGLLPLLLPLLVLCFMWDPSVPAGVRRGGGMAVEGQSTYARTMS